MGTIQNGSYISQYTGDQIDAALGKALNPDTTPTANSTNLITSGGVYDGLQRKSNPNLLDNWYFVGGGSQQGGGQFPINQRGQTTYANDGYGIDRWRMIYDIGAVQLGNDGLIFDASENAITWFQPFESLTGLVGKTVTVSVLYTPLASIEDTSVTAIYSGIPGTVTNKLAINGNANSTYCRSLTYTFDSDIVDPVWMYVSEGEQVKVHAIKYELGSTQTLAHQDENGDWVLNEIPNYQQELAKCQRYYAKLVGNNVFSSYGNGITFGTSSAAMVLQPPVPLRTLPTITLNGDFQLFYAVAGTGFAIHTFSLTNYVSPVARYISGSMLEYDFDVTPTPPIGVQFILQSSGQSFISLSADL